MKNKITIIIVVLSILCLATVLVACDGKGDTTSSGNTGSGDNSSIIIDENNQPPKFDGDDDIDYSKAVIIEGTTLTGLTEYGKTLSRIVIPDGLTSIGDMAFFIKDDSGNIVGNQNLLSVEIPSSVTYIGEGAFGYCINLSYINIPNSIQTIGKGAFTECHRLTSIELTSNIVNLTAPFPGCYSLVIKYPNSKLPDNWSSTTYLGAPQREIPVVFNSYSNEIADDGNVYVVANNGVQYALKDGIAKVAGSSYIFGDVIIASNIIYKDMNYNVTRIGFGSFSVCSNLTSIYIPSSVTSIDDVAFEGCISLESVIFEDNSKLSSIGNGAFFYCANLKNIAIPTGVTSIDYQAFSGCSNIANIEIPKSVTSIGDYVFSGCNSLTIYCEAQSKPSEWSSSWNGYRPVVWGYKK